MYLHNLLENVLDALNTESLKTKLTKTEIFLVDEENLFFST